VLNGKSLTAYSIETAMQSKYCVSECVKINYREQHLFSTIFSEFLCQSICRKKWLKKLLFLPINMLGILRRERKMRIDQAGSVPQINLTQKKAEQVELEVAVRVAEQAVQVKEVKQQAEEQDNVINDEMLDKAVEQANKALAHHNRRIERNVHEVTKTIMYTMKDTETDEVIREFPPKKIQDMIAKMWELAGLFVDEKA